MHFYTTIYMYLTSLACNMICKNLSCGTKRDISLKLACSGGTTSMKIYRNAASSKLLDCLKE